MKYKIYSKKQKQSSRSMMRNRNINYAGAMHHIDTFMPDNKIIEKFFLAMVSTAFLTKNFKHMRTGL